MIFSDDFHRANGNLIGTNDWIMSELADTGPVIVANQLTVTTDGTFSAVHPDSFSTLVPTDPWYIAMTAVIGVVGLPLANIGIWWGDITVASVYVQFSYSTTFGGGNNCQVTITDAVGNNTSATIVAPTPNASHEYALGVVAGELVAYIDDVPVCTTAGAVLSPVANNNFGVFFTTDPLAPHPVITLVEVETGP